MCSDCLDEFQAFLDSLVERHPKEGDQAIVVQQGRDSLHEFVKDLEDEDEDDDEWLSGDDDE